MGVAPVLIQSNETIFVSKPIDFSDPQLLGKLHTCSRFSICWSQDRDPAEVEKVPRWSGCRGPCSSQ